MSHNKMFGGHDVVVAVEEWQMEGDTKSYYTISPTTRTLMMAALVLIIGVLSWSAYEQGADVGTTLERLAPFLVIGGILGFSVFRVAHTIVIRESDGSVAFRTFLGSRVVPVSTIRSISPSFIQQGQWVVKHDHGSVAIPGQFEGLHDILEWIRRANPHVVLKGL